MRGTAFGRPVVPEVAKIIANSSGSSVCGLPVNAGSVLSSRAHVMNGQSLDSSGISCSAITAKGFIRSSVPVNDSKPAFSLRGAEDSAELPHS